MSLMKTTTNRAPRNLPSNTAALAVQMVRASLAQSKRDLAKLPAELRGYKVVEIAGLEAALTDMTWG